MFNPRKPRPAPTIGVGSILDNGALVLEIRNRCPRERVVLCSQGRGEYVTWKIDPTGDTFYGHYFGDRLDQAVADFATR